MIESLSIIIALLVGIGVGYWMSQKMRSAEPESNTDELQSQLNQLQVEREQLQIEKSKLEERVENSLTVFREKSELIERQSGQVMELTGASERLLAEKKALEDKLEAQVGELEKLDSRFKSEFKVLAGDILKQNTRDFSDSNKKQIDEVIRPFKEKIDSFEKRVNEVYRVEADSRSELMGQVKSLMELNKKISEDATNLTRALKGDSQKQGAWGEFILESILEHSGLEKGVEYETQTSTRTEDGLFRPDVIVNLPDEQYIVIDSKVSLVDYEAFVNESDEDERQKRLALHVASIKTHVKGLSGKNYQLKTKGQSLDFVLMFVPIEASFSEALRFDPSLYNFAWDKRIVIVSPTTLLATLRTVASVWKQEKQSRNVIQIAEESGKMYDKFVLFLEDLEKIRRGLDQGSSALQGAMNKLQTGNGNLIRRAEKVKELGAKTSKSVPDKLLGDD
ncbi:MAG: DNA recombination protein RmuC [Flavobacteriales bacterium]|jgi:DNA recombination protein RmuC|nr:DNA recombination protein RmuC [Flavobacteriales bacterium]